MTPAERAVAAAVSRIGRSEIGQNRGPIVEECCRPFLSQEDFDRLYPAGKLLWCAGFVCLCWCEAWPDFRQFASLSCQTLWDRLSARGWTRARDARVPQPGDLIFWRNRATGRINHVGIVETTGRAVQTIEGNSPTSLGDTGSVGRHRYAPEAPLIHGYAFIEVQE